jgi:hypothetical protein
LSATGYYEDAYDFAAFAQHVLIPLGAGGNRRYRVRIIDLASDEPRDEPLVEGRLMPSWSSTLRTPRGQHQD